MPLQMVFCATVLVLILICGHSVYATNIISGTVFDKTRNPLPDIDVELLDDYYRAIAGGRQRTSSSGRYEFQVQNDGRYYVKVYAFRYDLMDDMHEVVVQSISAVPGGSGSSFNVEDFYLEPKKGGLADAELSVVFAQDVPKDAKKLYESASANFMKKKPVDGIMNLVEAVKIYPDYYLALQRLTRELYFMKKYIESFQYARKVVAVNPKSGTGYYYMGASLHAMGKDFNPAALTALEEAGRLAPGSVQVLFALGRLERTMGKLVPAEKHLVAAKKIAGSNGPEIHAELADLYAQDMKKYGEAADALEDYMKAAKLNDADQRATKQKIADLRAKAKAQ
jgi:tetratricopeptide (TPR) repeat protein